MIASSWKAESPSYSCSVVELEPSASEGIDDLVKFLFRHFTSTEQAGCLGVFTESVLATTSTRRLGPDHRYDDLRKVGTVPAQAMFESEGHVWWRRVVKLRDEIDAQDLLNGAFARLRPVMLVPLSRATQSPQLVAESLAPFTGLIERPYLPLAEAAYSTGYGVVIREENDSGDAAYDVLVPMSVASALKRSVPR